MRRRSPYGQIANLPRDLPLLPQKSTIALPEIKNIEEQAHQLREKNRSAECGAWTGAGLGARKIHRKDARLEGSRSRSGEVSGLPVQDG